MAAGGGPRTGQPGSGAPDGSIRASSRRPAQQATGLLLFRSNDTTGAVMLRIRNQVHRPGSRSWRRRMTRTPPRRSRRSGRHRDTSGSSPPPGPAHGIAGFSQLPVPLGALSLRHGSSHPGTTAWCVPSSSRRARAGVRGQGRLSAAQVRSVTAGHPDDRAGPPSRPAVLVPPRAGPDSDLSDADWPAWSPG